MTLGRIVTNSTALADVPAPADTLAFHAALPGYAASPLHELPTLAAELGLDAVYVKDESSRFGLPAFKFLGASWAIARMLGGGADLDDLARRAWTLGVRRLTTATDGNHGRAVAHMARLLGLEATIYVPATCAPARMEAIAGEGADVVTVAAGYDAAVRASIADAAADPSARAANDADLDGTSPFGEWVIEGYGTLFAEAAAQLDAPVDVLVLQLGVGAFAAAGVRWAVAGGVRAIGSEPRGAACIAASLHAGVPVTLATSHTTMACLDAESPSAAGWSTLKHGMEAVIVLEDAESDEAMRGLAALGIESGESGAAGFAGLVALITDPSCASLRRQARRVLVISTEGATDPRRYAEVVGR